MTRNEYLETVQEASNGILAVYLSKRQAIKTMASIMENNTHRNARDRHPFKGSNFEKLINRKPEFIERAFEMVTYKTAEDRLTEEDKIEGFNKAYTADEVAMKILKGYWSKQDVEEAMQEEGIEEARRRIFDNDEKRVVQQVTEYQEIIKHYAEPVQCHIMKQSRNERLLLGVEDTTEAEELMKNMSMKKMKQAIKAMKAEMEEIKQYPEDTEF